MIAVVDGYSTGAWIADRLRRHDISAVHIRSTPDPGEHFAHSFRPEDYEDEMAETSDSNTIATALRRRGVKRVVAGTESGVELADLLNATLGTPGNDPVLSTARRDKSAMLRAARAAGVRVPHSRIVPSAAEAVRWASNSGVAAWVAKPLRSAGGDHVVLCSDHDQLAAACERILADRTIYGEPNTQVLVQERLRGTEYYVNTVSEDGIHRVAEMWRYIKRPSARTPVYDHEEPVVAGSLAARTLAEFTVRVLNALGITDSAAHTELFLTPDGPVLVEVGARLGGATAPDVVRTCCGVSQLDVLTTALVDRLAFVAEPGHRWAGSPHVRNVSLINDRPGTVTSGWADRLCTLPTLHRLVTVVEQGQHLGPTGDLLDSPGYAYLVAPEPAQIERDYLVLRSWERNGLYTR